MTFKDRIILGETKMVRLDGDMPITMDGSLSPIAQDDGSVLYFATDLGEAPFFRAFKGSVSDPFQKQAFTFDWDFNDYPKEWPCGLWAQSVYRCDDGMLIGFTHREDLNRNDKTSRINYHIGLGVSNDGGHSWFYAGDICGTMCNYIPRVHANMGGCPTVVHDGFFQVYFNEYNPDGTKIISAARFAVDETIEKLKAKKLPKVYKYSGNGIWDTPAIGGTGKAIVVNPKYETRMKKQIQSRDSDVFEKDGGIFLCHSRYLDTHSKAVFCEPLGCYLMTLHVYNEGKLLLYFSGDAEHWDEYITVDEVPVGAGITQHYSTFVDSSKNGRPDSFTVGNRFMLHIVHKNMKHYPEDEYLVREITVK